MISNVLFKNFKALRDVDIGLGKLTVLVGPNASGKTSILEAMHYLGQLTRKRPEELFTGPRELRFLHTSGTVEPTKVVASAGKIGLSLTAEPQPDGWTGQPLDDEDGRDRWKVEVRGTAMHGSEPDWKWELYWAPTPSLTEQSRGALQASFGRAVFLRLDADRLASPSYSHREIPRVEYNGEGLASVLAYLKLNMPDRFGQILHALQAVVTTVRDIRFGRAKVYRAESQIVAVGENRQRGTRTATSSLPRSVTDRVHSQLKTLQAAYRSQLHARMDVPVPPSLIPTWAMPSW